MKSKQMLHKTLARHTVNKRNIMIESTLTEVSPVVHDMSTTVTYCCIQELKPGTKVWWRTPNKRKERDENGGSLQRPLLGKVVYTLELTDGIVRKKT